MTAKKKRKKITKKARKKFIQDIRSRTWRVCKSSVKFGGLLAAGVFVLSIVAGGAYRFLAPHDTINMVDRRLRGELIKYEWRTLDDISSNLVLAVIAAEDTRFCQHSGFDFKEIESAIAAAKTGKSLRGASTISQQTAKNVFLWNGGGWLRKGGEAWMTFVIEGLWSKRRVLEVYLNIAEWGDGHFGAEAAAQYYFGKTASQLSKPEAAQLAAVLPSPNKWRADRPGKYVQSRTGTILKRMTIVERDALDICILN